MEHEAAAPVKKKKKRIVLRIFLILLAVIVLGLLGGYTYWVIRGSRLDMPFGLEPGMSLAEARQALAENGLTEKYASEKEVSYFPASVLGVPESIVSLNTGRTSVSLRLSYHDAVQVSGDGSGEVAAYDTDNHSPEFTQVFSELKSRYGTPHESDLDGRHIYEWSGIRPNFDFYSVNIRYSNDNRFFVVYSCSKGGLFK